MTISCPKVKEVVQLLTSHHTGRGRRFPERAYLLFGTIPCSSCCGTPPSTYRTVLHSFPLDARARSVLQYEYDVEAGCARPPPDSRFPIERSDLWQSKVVERVSLLESEVSTVPYRTGMQSGNDVACIHDRLCCVEYSNCMN